MQAILNVAFPIFGVILAGYLAGRWRILGGEATGALNAFVSYFALPVLFFGTLARTPVAAVLDPSLMAGFGIAVVATFVVGMATTRLVSRGGLAAMSLQGIASSWGNVGYMGVPLCLAAFVLLLPAARAADEVAMRTAITEASAYLINQGQAADGGFSSQAGPAVTALAVTALVKTGTPVDALAVQKGIDYLLRFKQADGGIYPPDSFGSNYETSIAMVALAACNRDGRYDEQI